MSDFGEKKRSQGGWVRHPLCVFEFDFAREVDRAAVQAESGPASAAMLL